MPIPFSSRPLLALPLMAPLFGCASEPPIVLRPPHPGHHTVHAPESRRNRERAVAGRAATTPGATGPSRPDKLDPTDKEALFREFDDYLSHAGTAQAAPAQPKLGSSGVPQ